MSQLRPLVVVGSVAMAVPLAFACGGEIADAGNASDAGADGAPSQTDTSTTIPTTTTTISNPSPSTTVWSYSTTVGTSLPSGGPGGVDFTPSPQTGAPSGFDIGYSGSCTAIPDICGPSADIDGSLQAVVGDCAKKTAYPCLPNNARVSATFGEGGCLTHLDFPDGTAYVDDEFMACVAWETTGGRCGDLPGTANAFVNCAN